TNLVAGTLDAKRIQCDGFSLGSEIFDASSLANGSAVSVSIRPQALRLHDTPPADHPDATQVTIRSRTYLGEHWDYLITPEGSDISLRVCAPPAAAFERGGKAWM